MDPIDALRRFGGVARWTELERAGVRRGALLSASHRGTVVRPHRGCFALPNAKRAAVLATIFRAQPTCVTWCESVGLQMEQKPTLAHLGVPQSRGLGEARSRPTSEVVLHRHGSYDWMLALEHLDIAAQCTSPVQQVALLDEALRRGLITPPELERLQHGSTWRRSWVRHHVDLRAGSMQETVARVELREAGFLVQPQALISDVGSVDLLVEGSVVVETDGYAYHSDRRAFAADRDRDRRLHVLGFQVLRYTQADVLHHADQMVADVTALLWRQRRLTDSVRTRIDAAARVSHRDWWR
ncbi:type IV toxin-antitoxin system AbiEi family antitoxin domain-containing protein [Demequina sp. NBRC 110052]|uniref:type IV toxin-antitoxin system AbiEi family antitoxin domain-containing protein n=1 Tax=Demequina sp. NBRC 110052 TaxID=1570341 RepID=UPI000A070481|nr:type IV toxin-antitoxin system AbiEi family antitoxin domain-containing protein [Demequina sp. NBRC 110052]